MALRDRIQIKVANLELEQVTITPLNIQEILIIEQNCKFRVQIIMTSGRSYFFMDEASHSIFNSISEAKIARDYLISLLSDDSNLPTSEDCLTPEDRIKLDSIQKGAEVNAIIKISLNGEILPISSGRIVNIDLPTLEQESFSGEFNSLAELQQKVPVGISGSFAYIINSDGLTVTRYAWNTTTNRWVSTLEDSSFEKFSAEKLLTHSNQITNIQELINSGTLYQTQIFDKLGNELTDRSKLLLELDIISSTNKNIQETFSSVLPTMLMSTTNSTEAASSTKQLKKTTYLNNLKAYKQQVDKQQLVKLKKQLYYLNRLEANQKTKTFSNTLSPYKKQVVVTKTFSNTLKPYKKITKKHKQRFLNNIEPYKNR